MRFKKMKNLIIRSSLDDTGMNIPQAGSTSSSSNEAFNANMNIRSLNEHLEKNETETNVAQGNFILLIKYI